MTTTGVHEQQAAEFLARHDRVMANLMKRTGPFHLPRPSRSHFAALAESILHQQLAGAAARAIHRRFVALFDGDLSPNAVLTLSPRGFARRDSRAGKSPRCEISRRGSWMVLSRSLASAGSPTRKSSHASRASVGSDAGPPRCS